MVFIRRFPWIPSNNDGGVSITRYFQYPFFTHRVWPELQNLTNWQDDPSWPVVHPTIQTRWTSGATTAISVPQPIDLVLRNFSVATELTQTAQKATSWISTSQVHLRSQYGRNPVGTDVESGLVPRNLVWCGYLTVKEFPSLCLVALIQYRGILERLASSCHSWRSKVTQGHKRLGCTYALSTWNISDKCNIFVDFGHWQL